MLFKYILENYDDLRGHLNKMGKFTLSLSFSTRRWTSFSVSNFQELRFCFFFLIFRENIWNLIQYLSLKELWIRREACMAKSKRRRSLEVKRHCSISENPSEEHRQNNKASGKFNLKS